MKKLMILLALPAVAGCFSTSCFTEGTSFQLGLYAPVDGQIIGMDVCSYVNGIRIQMPQTNASYVIERQHAATNSYFGVVKTCEYSKTKVEAKR